MELHTRHFDDTSLNAILQNVAYGSRATNHSSISASPSQLAFGIDMILNAVYLANWNDLKTRRLAQVHRNNTHESKSRIPHDNNIGDSVYIRKSNVEQKLNPLQGPFTIDKVHTKMVPLRFDALRQFVSVLTSAVSILHLHGPIREASAIR
jgi:hypothetical protein